MNKILQLSVGLLLGSFATFSAEAINKPFELNGIVYCVNDNDETTVSVDKPIGSGTAAYTYYNGMVNIPATINYEGNTYTVTSISHDAFTGQQKLTTVIIPKTVETIGYKAFKGSSIQSLSFNSAGVLNTIDYEAFNSCENLTSVTFPNSLKTIGHHAFEDCSGIKTIKWGTSLETIDKAAFKGCDALLELEIPSSVKRMEDMCFWGCAQLRKVVIGSSVEYLGANAFLDCKALDDVTLSNSIKEMGYETFRGCWNLETIEIPNSVTTIGYGAFRYCVSLRNVTLSENLESIPQYCFEQTDITSITIPNSVKIISLGAFASCPNLSAVSFGRGLEEIWDQAFISCPELTEVYLHEPLKSIGGAAFSKCDKLSYVSIPRTCATLGASSFAECHQLENVDNFATVPQPIFNGSVFALSGPEGVVNVHVLENLYETYTTALGWYDIGTEYLCHVNIIADIPIVDISEIEFVDDPIKITVGEQATATYNIYPDNAVSTQLEWSSSDESVLFVDMYSGVFVGLEPGEAILTVSVPDSEVSASVKVIVSEDSAVSEISTDSEAQTVIYDIFGCRLNKLQRGINIVNGKKIFVK